MKFTIFSLSILLMVFATTGSVSAQNAPTEELNKFTISGYVKDASSGEVLIGAAIYVKEIGKGTVSNLYGFYSLSLEQGTYNLNISYMGYKNITKKIVLTKSVKLNVELESSALQQEEVEIIAQRKDINIKSTDIGKVEMQMEKIKNIPAIMGETDILKTLQLLPGVQSGGEGSSAFYVRGGGADQNLILLDEAVVFNSGHLFGFFSVFNSDAIKNTTLLKGSMPAEYGGRLSSVLDISMKDGNNKKYHTEGGIGLISSRLMVEGPIVKDKSSFMVSGRRTYIDVIVKPFIREELRSNGYYFYDFNTKFNYAFSDKDRLFFSGYFGRDVFSFASNESDFNISIPWGNATTTLRWNHLFSDKLFLNTSLIYNDYNFEFDVKSDDFNMIVYSGIKDMNLKLDFGYYPGLTHKLKYGVNYTYHTFTPSTGSASFGDSLEFDTKSIARKYGHETAFYVSDEFDINEVIRINAGLRFSTFSLVPPYDLPIYDEYGRITDTILYRNNDKVATYSGFEPRINARFRINEATSIKASYIHTLQYIHMVSNSSSTLPTDVWVPSSKMVKPQIGDQYSIGFFKNFMDNKIETSVELYYKKMQNQIEYKDGYVETLGRELEWDFVFGTGTSYGIEFLINKRYGKTTGWIGYTLSKTDRHFDDLLTKDFPAKFDRRHDLSIVAIHELNEHWTFGATFVYASGNTTTLPGNFYLIENSITNDYMPRNSFRLEPYHRADISATWKHDFFKKGSTELVFAVYNVYNHKNIYFMYFDSDGSIQDGDFENKAYKVTLFPVLPSISFNFKF